MTEKPTIKASWLGSHEYCEYKWYLENIMKEEIPIVRAMIVGKHIHKVKEDEFRKVAKPTTPKEFLESKFYTITKEIGLKKEFDNFVLIGKIETVASITNFTIYLTFFFVNLSLIVLRYQKPNLKRRRVSI